jgi:hypothetical protein
MIDETSLSARVDELIAAMTPAEKAGQLTQYFYFGRAVETIDVPDVEGVPANPSAAVEAALGSSTPRAPMFRPNPARTSVGECQLVTTALRVTESTFANTVGQAGGSVVVDRRLARQVPVSREFAAAGFGQGATMTIG